MKDKTKTQKLHIVTIIIGTIFILLSAFHSNIWFDEAYSVGMAERTITEIWNIGGHDVHPVLYYWMLRIVGLVVSAWGATNIATKIIIYRIFSAIPISLLGILGYTHIKKDFGEKVGIIFSFLVFFLPESILYANEIRMYSWAILAVTVLAIYAYRLRLPENSNRKNWLIFFVASISSIFLHYYGLMAAGLINVVLLVYLIFNKRGKDILAICLFGLIQLIAYVPWLIYFVSQLKSIQGGFWIKYIFPESLYELVAGQFIGNLKYKKELFILTTIFYIYLIIKLLRSKENKLPAILSIGLYLAVIIAAIIMTKVLHTEILYYRYLFVTTGLLIFAISYILGKTEHNKVIWVICAMIAIIGTANNIEMIKDAYGENNFKQYEYLKENIQESDKIIYDEIGHGSTIAIYFTENQQYFYNPEKWNVKEAYKALGEHMQIYTEPEEVDKIEGRIWIIDKMDESLYNKLFNNEQYKIISKEEFCTEYHDYSMKMILVEKVNN